MHQHKSCGTNEKMVGLHSLCYTVESLLFKRINVHGFCALPVPKSLHPDKIATNILIVLKLPTKLCPHETVKLCLSTNIGHDKLK